MLVKYHRTIQNVRSQVNLSKEIKGVKDGFVSIYSEAVSHRCGVECPIRPSTGRSAKASTMPAQRQVYMSVIEYRKDFSLAAADIAAVFDASGIRRPTRQTAAARFSL